MLNTPSTFNPYHRTQGNSDESAGNTPVYVERIITTERRTVAEKEAAGRHGAKCTCPHLFLR